MGPRLHKPVHFRPPALPPSPLSPPIPSSALSHIHRNFHTHTYTHPCISRQPAERYHFHVFKKYPRSWLRHKALIWRPATDNGTVISPVTPWGGVILCRCNVTRAGGETKRHLGRTRFSLASMLSPSCRACRELQAPVADLQTQRAACSWTPAASTSWPTAWRIGKAGTSLGVVGCSYGTRRSRKGLGL